MHCVQTWKLPFLIAFLIAAHPAFGQQGTQWIFPRAQGDALTWGHQDGIVFGLPSTGGMTGPRGLICVGTWNKQSGTAELLNYIAIEPVVAGRKERGSRMGFSELEKSGLDPGKQGARIWVGGPPAAPSSSIRTEKRGMATIEVLNVRMEIEPFTQNGAHVYVLLSVASDRPNELRLTAYPYPDSKALDEVTFTATMGAYERLRRLWLKDKVIDSRELYAGYSGPDFAELENYPAARMLRDSYGAFIALCTPSEKYPASARNREANAHWYYRGPPLTQYWKVSQGDAEANLRVRVNGRHVYWHSKDSIPGGNSFENFELRERYRPGQTFIFGVSTKEPWEWVPSLATLGKKPELE